MSILIKGMDMPKSCRGCGLLQEFDECYWCACNSYLVFGDIEHVPNYVMNGCPLTEIPKHGRLIDADAIQGTHAIARCLDDGHNWNELCVTMDEIADMPTIIEGDTE